MTPDRSTPAMHDAPRAPAMHAMAMLRPRRWLKRVAAACRTRLQARFLGTVMRVETGEPIAALTFDDGPHPRNTPRILDVLERHQARATFFMLGCNVERYPDVVAEVRRRGHAIGNHSWDHPAFPHVPACERRRQLAQTDQALGRPTLRLFRPPFGSLDGRSRLDLLRARHQVILFDVQAEDWLGHPAGQLVENIRRDMRPGSIILLHDALFSAEQPEYSCRRATIDAVDQLLATMSDYSFVTVPELLERGRPEKTFWVNPGDPEWIGQLTRIDYETDAAIAE